MMKTNDFSQLKNLINASENTESSTLSVDVSATASHITPSETATTENQNPTARGSSLKKLVKRQMPTMKSRNLPSQKNKHVNVNHPNEFLLRRNIKTLCCRIKATISKAAERDDLMPVLIRARENNGTYSKDIAQHLLGEAEGREIVGKRLLDIGTSLGLLENKGESHRPRYYLTKDGEKALESNKVMVPEEGTWTIWASNDPLLNYPILHIAPYHEASAFDEVFGKKKQETKERNDSFEDVPAWLKHAESTADMPIALGNELIRIDNIDNKIEKVDANTNLVVKWFPEKSELHVEGNINGTSVNSTPNSPQVDFGSLWQELLKKENLWDQWQEAEKCLLVTFEETDESERASMLRQLRFSRPDLHKFGKFESTSQNIEIFPQSLEDAQLWARWKLLEKINAYATKAIFTKWQEEARLPFNEYANQLTLPQRETLAQHYWNNRNVSQAQQKQTHNQQNLKNTSSLWHLVAVEDWGI